MLFQMKLPFDLQFATGVIVQVTDIVAASVVVLRVEDSIWRRALVVGFV